MSHESGKGGKPPQGQVSISINGRPLEVREGQNLSAALWSNGYLELGQDPYTGARRTVFCGIGHCGQCLVTVDGIEDQRACRLNVRDGMHIEFPEEGSETDGGHGH